MPIRFSSDAPIDAHDRIQARLSTEQRVATGIGLRALSGALDMHLSEGIQTWTAGLDDIDADVLQSAAAGAWRYLVVEGSTPTAEAHVTRSGGSTDVVGMSHGPTTGGIAAAFSAAEHLPEVQMLDFEPRLLLVPSVLFVGLWLHFAADNSQDIVIPMPPTSIALPLLTPVSPAVLTSALRAASADVRAQIANNAGPSGGTGRAGHLTQTMAARFPDCLTLRALDLRALAIEAALFRGGTARAELPHFMQNQLQSNWCWSAVGTSVGLLFRTGKWTQCDTATHCLRGVDCCRDPSSGNVYGFLDKSLTYTKSFSSISDGPAPLDSVVAEVGQGRPVCVRVAWSGGGAHFMAITGFDGTEITIQDSVLGTTNMPYASYPMHYHGGGTWTHSYYCASGGHAPSTRHSRQ